MDILQTVGSLTPIGIIGLLGYCIYLLIEQGKGQKKIAENHLHELPEVVPALQRIEVLLIKMHENVIEVKTRMEKK